MRWKPWWLSMAKSSPLMSLLAGGGYETFDPEAWSLLFSEARRAGLLARLAASLRLDEVGLPERLQKQVTASLIEAAAFQRDVLRELEHVQQALQGLGVPVLLLKGAAYVRLNLPAARGRIFSDIDIVVAKESLAQAEASLMLGGWLTGKLDPYDQRYYREWSHEVPPMTHRRRGTTIDLHHALVMPTCRIRVDSGKMIREAVPVDGSAFWWRLQDEDMVLHAASHLMFNSEFERGLRDIWDIDLLFRDFASRSASFPERLFERAHEVGLGEVIREALRLARALLGTPVPENLLPGDAKMATRLVARAVYSRHRQTRPAGQWLADMLLVSREMYLRLPNHLLLTHLAHKASLGFTGTTPHKAI